MQQAIRLSPHDPFKTIWDTNLGDIEIGAGRPEAAIIECRKALDAGDHTYWIYANLAASYALLGKMDEAKPSSPKPFASIPALPSNGFESTSPTTFRPATKACARRGLPRGMNNVRPGPMHPE